MDNETPRFCGEAEENYFSTTISTKPIEPKRFSIIDLILASKLEDGKKDLSSNFCIKKVNRKSKIEEDINEFMGKNKFLLRKDSDENNIEKFLLSKEKAFESPL